MQEKAEMKNNFLTIRLTLYQTNEYRNKILLCYVAFASPYSAKMLSPYKWKKIIFILIFVDFL